MKPELKAALLLVLSMVGAGISGCNKESPVTQCYADHCGSVCVDFDNDEENCGACGLACATGEVCRNQQCVERTGASNNGLSCQAGELMCGSTCIDGMSD